MQDALNWFPEMGCVEAEAAYFAQPMKANASPESLRATFHLPATVPFHVTNEKLRL
jgi:hypothetical protein